MRKGKKTRDQEEAAFWNREFSANDVRKKSLDDLNYISFSTEPFYPLTLLGADLSSQFLAENEEAKQILSRFLFLENQKIVNLNHLSNTDLKFMYGVANLNILTEYDSNYSELITLLHTYGSLLADAGYESQALTVLEYAISIGSDISTTYLLCAKLYQKMNQPEAIDALKKEAEKIPTSRKTSIVRKLQEFDPCND